MEALTLNTAVRNAPQQGDAALFERNAAGATRSGGSDFGSVLGKVQQRGNEDPATFARRSAENFVAIGLVQPLLKQMRESNHAAPPFAPTDGEKQFQGLADAELA
jgi:Rod binding domain-containing protein